MKNVTFKNYCSEDYDSLCAFLIELNEKDRKHINWNWARLEWMIVHPYLDKSSLGSIGLWFCEGKIVGAAIYDMSFGEAFCGVLPQFLSLYPDVLSYAYEHLKDDAGLGIAIADDNEIEITFAKDAGFVLHEQSETIMSIDLDEDFPVSLGGGLHLEEFNPADDPMETNWIIWQGFDHGDDRDEFEKNADPGPFYRKHFNSHLNIVSADEFGKKGSYACLWYCEGTDYAYVEPVCVIPSFRGKGAGKAMIYELLNRAKAMGAKKAYVISDMGFYSKLGFKTERHFSFYWKK